MTVIPIYVRESSHEPQHPPPPPPTITQSGESRTAADSDDIAATEITNDEQEVVDNSNIDDRISSGYDVISSTGLRRRRGGGGGGDEAEDDVSNIGSSLSLSTISTHDNADNGIDHNLPNHRPISPPVHQQSSASHIPSRPTRQSFLHQRSSGSAADPMTPLINNYSRQQRRLGADGVAGLPPSPPRAARPSSLSNGLSLSFWSSIVDGILGNPNDGGRGGSSGGHIPPIHRRPGYPGAVSNRNAGQGRSNGETNADGGIASSEGNNPSRTGSPPISTSNFLPITVEDSTTEFLSRLLLLLGSFVIFCLLLF